MCGYRTASPDPVCIWQLLLEWRPHVLMLSCSRFGVELGTNSNLPKHQPSATFIISTKRCSMHMQYIHTRIIDEDSKWFIFSCSSQIPSYTSAEMGYLKAGQQRESLYWHLKIFQTVNPPLEFHICTQRYLMFWEKWYYQRRERWYYLREKEKRYKFHSSKLTEFCHSLLWTHVYYWVLDLAKPI